MKSYWIAAVLLSSLFFSRCFVMPRPSSLRVSFLDVGQGDSILITFPHGSTWLVDGGPATEAWSAGIRVIMPELSHRQIRQLDRVILSHPDLDHLGGLEDLYDFLRIREFVWNEAHRGSATLGGPLRSLLERAWGQRQEARSIRHLVGGTLEGVDWTLIPVRTGNQSNNSSLVLRLSYQSKAFLFTGDLEEKGEERLLELHRQLGFALRSDVLKVAHHGSKTSTRAPILDAVKPRWAVISAGQSNSYGHPHGVTLRALRSRAIRVLRTDIHGMTEFEVDAVGKISCRSGGIDCDVH